MSKLILPPGVRSVGKKDAAVEVVPSRSPRRFGPKGQRLMVDPMDRRLTRGQHRAVGSAWVRGLEGSWVRGMGRRT